ncbi:hypothetical protein B0H19DRAFT_1138347 [Mycena capillaripes]|nr:hypothetical protein B0H19DRAFT_1138347 [Mycena capillaripes]
MLSHLSVELLEEIGSKLAQRDHANLRAVCKDISSAMQRFFFSCLVLRTGEEMQSETGLEMLKALATGQTGWSYYTRTLRIQPAKSTKTRKQLALEATVSDAEIQELLAFALKSMANVRTVIWKAHESLPAWEVQTICPFLNGLPALSELELDFQGNLHLSSLKLSNIRKFTFKNGRWGGANITPTRNPSSFQEIISLVTENRLTSLHLEADNEWTKVWNLLRGKTQLTEVTTNLVTPELFDYLRSYTGLQKLALVYPNGGNRNKSNLLADTFFETVLPQHATSLVELSCPAAYEGRFSFGTHNVDVISQMHSLTTLEMSINAGRVRSVDRNKRNNSDKTAPRMIAFSIGQEVEIEQSDIDPVVTLFLQTAATLPALRSLAIVSANTESNRGVRCGNGITHHRGPVTMAIEVSVKKFRSNVPCSAIVRAGHHTYHLQPANPETSEEGRPESELEMLTYQETGMFQRF